MRRFLVFLVSIVALVLSVTWYDHLEDGLSTPHGMSNALVLLAAERWTSDGLFSMHLTPAVSSGKAGDTFALGSGTRAIDQHGDGYYTSAPFLAILPIYILKLVQPSLATPKALHLLALISVASASLLLFAIIRRSATREQALLGTGFFLASPLTWIFGIHIWSWDTAWLLPTLGAYAAFDRRRVYSLAFFSALAVLMDRQGLLMILPLAIVEARRSLKSTALVLSAISISCLLVLYLYSHQVGISAFVESFQNRYVQRATSRTVDWSALVADSTFQVTLASALTLILLSVASGRKDRLQLLACLSCIGAVLDVLIVPGWHTAHLFGWWKFLIPTAIAGASVARDKFRMLAFAVLILVTTFYSVTTQPPRYADQEACIAKLGEDISDQAEEEYPVYLMASRPAPAALNYYSGRTVRHATSVEQVNRELSKTSFPKATTVALEDWCQNPSFKIVDTE